ncbi:MAG: sensor histidine kinase [Fidelibacterota bacterium]
MKNKIYYHSATIKRILILIAIVMIFSLLFYSQKIVNDLRDDSTKLMNFYAEVYTDAMSYSGNDLSFVFEKIIQNISIPMILSEKRDTLVQTWKNIDIAAETPSQTDTLKILAKMREMDNANEPIRLSYEDITLGYIHYGDTDLINKLRMLPYIEIGLVSLFILLGYIGFQQIRTSERSSIWAGMAKETAHQLGTPLSSLMGWLAVMESEEPENDIVREMKQDINRLNKVTNRFSKIGSKPNIQYVILTPVILEAVKYYQRRLPQLNRKVQIIFDDKKQLYGNINADIFSWSIENLIKNSIDAIGDKDGEVKIVLSENREKELVHIDVTDNGKGIEKKNWDNIFRPGYSTKRRGWGLGLSLTRRIVEQYHEGKIFVKTSKPGIGTTIRITIPSKK